MLLVWPWLPGAGPRGRDFWTASLMGVIVFTLGHRLQVWGNLLGSAGNSSVLMAVEPLLTAVAAAVFLREHIAPTRPAAHLVLEKGSDHAVERVRVRRSA